MTYRPDIDGLRAIAVLAVVIFHIGVTGFEGGYVGVDVFFVISGYLITSIIQRQHAAGRFSFADFYARRVRRLLPPLIATVFATTLACAAILDPYDMIAYGRSAVAALFSVSNILFFSEAGYWDTASELKPLLHTWSLGLEEQFYLLWPATIVGLLAWRGQRGLTLPLLCIAVPGTALCIAYTAVDAAAAFYLLPFRVFQFALGALMLPLADTVPATRLLRSGRGHTTVLATGLVLVLGSVFAFDAATAFPGWAVLVPSLGAALVLLAGNRPADSSTGDKPGRLARLLDNPISLWTGRASYAMYLVHWPIVALYRYESGQAPTAAAQVVLALATLVATALLHYGVERRFYQRETATQGATRQAVQRAPYRQSVPAILASLVLVALLPLSAWLGDGWSWREPDVVLSTEAIEAGMQRRYTHIRGACPVAALKTHAACDRARPLQVLVFGNSLEPDGYNFLRAGYGGPDTNLIRFGTTNQCRALAVPRPGQEAAGECEQRLSALLDDDVVSSLDVVVYSANMPFAANKSGHRDILAALRQRNPSLRIITIGGYINTHSECWRLINKAQTPAACRDPANVSYFADTPEEQPLYRDIMALTDHFVDRVGLLCANRELSACEVTAEDGTPAFYDRYHLSLAFASMAGRRYAARYPDLLRAEKSAETISLRLAVTPAPTHAPQNPPVAAPRRDGG